jgi:hypothetical protein
VAQLVEALRYKAEGRGFDWYFFYWLDPFRRTMVLVSTQPLTEMGCKGGRCVGLTTLWPSCADCLRNARGPEPRGALEAGPCIYSDCLTFTSKGMTTDSVSWALGAVLM